MTQLVKALTKSVKQSLNGSDPSVKTQVLKLMDAYHQENRQLRSETQDKIAKVQAEREAAEALLNEATENKQIKRLKQEVASLQRKVRQLESRPWEDESLAFKAVVRMCNELDYLHRNAAQMLQGMIVHLAKNVHQDAVANLLDDLCRCDDAAQIHYMLTNTDTGQREMNVVCPLAGLCLDLTPGNVALKLFTDQGLKGITQIINAETDSEFASATKALHDLVFPPLGQRHKYRFAKRLLGRIRSEQNRIRSVYP